MSEKFAIAETFHSLQGEGQWVGTPMLFVRLAGCSVGKPIVADPNVPLVNTGAKAWQCQAISGAHFWCDTDFSKKIEISPADLALDCYERHLCLTGGEPLMPHNHRLIQELYAILKKKEVMLHIETSGTILPPPMTSSLDDRDYWLTCSPKWDAMPRVVQMADEIKLLVDERFNPSQLPEWVRNHDNVYISPINPPTGLDEVTLTLCMRILEDYPEWKLSIQLHKVLGLR